MKLRILAILPILLLSSCDIVDGYNYADEGYQKYSGEVTDFTDIENINVDWLNGSVSIGQNYDNIVSFYENDSDYPLYYKVDGKELNIKVVKSGMTSRHLKKLDKSLYLSLPAFTNKLTVSTVDTSIQMYGNVEVESGSFNTVNGYFSAEKYCAKSTKINSVETSYYFTYMKCPNSELIKSTPDDEPSDAPVYLKHEVDIDAVSASIQIGVDKINGYKVNCSGVKWDFQGLNGGKKNYGDELLEIDFDGVSSSLSLFTNYYDYYQY